MTSVDQRPVGRQRTASPTECWSAWVSAPVDYLIDESPALPADEGFAVAAALIDSFADGEQAVIAEAWRQELRQRRVDLRSGIPQAEPWAFFGRVRVRCEPLHGRVPSAGMGKFIAERAIENMGRRTALTFV